jgi:AraC-like DNA-binding protein
MSILTFLKIRSYVVALLLLSMISCNEDEVYPNGNLKFEVTENAKLSDSEIKELLIASRTIEKKSGVAGVDSMRQILLKAISFTASKKQEFQLIHRVGFMFFYQYDSVKLYLVRMRKILDQMDEPYQDGEFDYYKLLGGVCKMKAKYSESLIAWEKAMEFAILPRKKVVMHLNLGILYRAMYDLNLSKEHYTKAFNISVNTDDLLRAASAQSIGAVWMDMGELDSALCWFEKAEKLPLMDRTKFRLFVNKSKVLLEQQKDKQAAESLSVVALMVNNSETTQAMLTNFWAVAGRILTKPYAYLLKLHIGDISYQEAFDNALTNADESDDVIYQMWCREYIAKVFQELNLKEQAAILLSEALNLKNTEFDMARMNVYKMETDLVKSQAEKERIEHQKEVLAKEKQQNIVFGSGLLVLLFSGGLWSRLRYISRTNKELNFKNNEILRKNEILFNQQKTIIDQESKIRELEEDWILEIKKIIRENIDSITSELLAEKMNTSLRTLHRKIKMYSQFTPDKLILDVRLRAAEELFIKHPEKNINEVAYQSGFNDPAYFSKVFKSTFGYSPSQYIADLKNLRMS